MKLIWWGVRGLIQGLLPGEGLLWQGSREEISAGRAARKPEGGRGRTAGTGHVPPVSGTGHPHEVRTKYLTWLEEEKKMSHLPHPNAVCRIRKDFFSDPDPTSLVILDPTLQRIMDPILDPVQNEVFKYWLTSKLYDFHHKLTKILEKIFSFNLKFYYRFFTDTDPKF